MFSFSILASLLSWFSFILISGVVAIFLSITLSSFLSNLFASFWALSDLISPPPVSVLIIALPNLFCSMDSSFDRAMFNLILIETSGWSFMEMSSYDKDFNALFKLTWLLSIVSPASLIDWAMSFAETDPYNCPASLAALIITTSFKTIFFAIAEASFFLVIFSPSNWTFCSAKLLIFSFDAYTALPWGSKKFLP